MLSDLYTLTLLSGYLIFKICYRAMPLFIYKWKGGGFLLQHTNDFSLCVTGPFLIRQVLSGAATEMQQKGNAKVSQAMLLSMLK